VDKSVHLDAGLPKIWVHARNTWVILGKTRGRKKTCGGFGCGGQLREESPDPVGAIWAAPTREILHFVQNDKGLAARIAVTALVV
jgi:hypothetical protein